MVAYQSLNRNSKSCRLRWVNYLRPSLKRGQLTPEEENIIRAACHVGKQSKVSTKYLLKRKVGKIMYPNMEEQCFSMVSQNGVSTS
ncbi:hypothetical protein IFM89_038868, partial [Coptis chinensis]